MIAKLHHATLAQQSPLIQITGSKSESNRLLLLQALYGFVDVSNISNSDDSEVMTRALQSNQEVIDIHHAGTAMRFLTAYFSIVEGRTTILTGSERMQERPIKVLVDALRSLGAKIDYVANEGFPPLKITGSALAQNEVEIDAHVSSQYISALLIIAPKLPNGLQLTLKGKITSVPYLKMTLALLNKIGVQTTFNANRITIAPLRSTPDKTIAIAVESDWSSASYYFSLVALSPVGTKIQLNTYKKDSLQGDAALVDIYKAFGIKTDFTAQGIVITKVSESFEPKEFDLNNTPDLAQTIAVTCLGLGISCDLKGLHTLKIKETDRLVALKTEIEKLGGLVTIDENSLQLERCQELKSNTAIETYNDHRMAMAFAPLCLKTALHINDAGVVSKSYPGFWEDLQLLGIKVTF